MTQAAQAPSACIVRLHDARDQSAHGKHRGQGHIDGQLMAMIRNDGRGPSGSREGSRRPLACGLCDVRQGLPPGHGAPPRWRARGGPAQKCGSQKSHSASRYCCSGLTGTPSDSAFSSPAPARNFGHCGPPPAGEGAPLAAKLAQ